MYVMHVRHVAVARRVRTMCGMGSVPVAGVPVVASICGPADVRGDEALAGRALTVRMGMRVRVVAASLGG